MTDKGYFVFDIETAAGTEPPHPELLQMMIDQRIKDPKKIEAALQELPSEFALHWYSGQIVCVGIRIGGITTCFYQEEGRFSEYDIIAFMWQLMKDYQLSHKLLVTYNGKSFDIPYFKFRSALLGIKPTVHLDTRKYSTDRHVDLYEIFGEKKLEFWARIFGIPFESNIKSADIPSLFKEGRIKEIVEHNSNDLFITDALFNKVEEYLL